jgi:hypothetical protein
MGYQNPSSDYTESDPDNRITRYTAYVTYSAWCAVYDSYIYRDFGADYFDNIDIYFRLKVNDATGGNTAQVAHLAFKNAVSCIKSGGGLALGVRSYRVAYGAVQIQLCTFNGLTVNASDASPYVTLGSYYYCRLVRSSSSTTATLYLYTDSARTNLWDTLQITHSDVSTKYRYLYLVAFILTGYGYGVSGETGNVTLPTQISGQLPGTSVFSADAKRVLKISGQLPGTSVFSADAKRVLKIGGLLLGTSVFSADAKRVLKISGQLPGSSEFSATEKMISKCSGGLDGLSTFSATAEMTAASHGFAFAILM